MTKPPSPSTFNVYCDESCHLEHDHQPVMVLGAIWCPAQRARETSIRIREIKRRHGLPGHVEVKWSRVSQSKRQMLVDLVDYFFDSDALKFRGLVAHKANLDHFRFRQDHDTWYYKMQYQMLKPVLRPNARFHIYLDIKDTKSHAKIEHLRDVLCTGLLDFDRQIIPRLDHVRSHEVQHVQLADLIVGAIGYRNRELRGNAGKEAVVARIVERAGQDLIWSSGIARTKFNIFHWHAAAAAPSADGR